MWTGVLILFVVSVRCSLIPGHVDMRAWGRHDTGWWGLLRWIEIRPVHIDVEHAAWVASRHIGPDGWVEHSGERTAYQRLLRLVLPTDTEAWPELWSINRDADITVWHGQLTTARPPWRR